MAQTADNPDADSNQPQAGTVIAPGNSEAEAVTPKPAAAPQPEVPAASPAPVVEEVEPLDPTAESPNLPTADIGQGEAEAEDEGQSITWTASEFIAHDKSPGWYLMLIIATLLGAAGIFLLTRDAVSVAVVIVAGLLLGIYAGHQPRQLEYMVNNRGFGIGPKYHTYDEFKWFSVAPEGAFSGIVFMPLRRFAVPTTIYYPPEDEDKILAIITNHLPLEEHKYDAVDNLMRRIRF